MRASSWVVLVVEDEWLVREMLVNELREDGWQLLEASTGEGAVAVLQAARQRIDIVITDIQLAGYLSGWDVAEAFRAVHPQMPVIYASGNSVERSRQVPRSVFFSKPYRTADVRDACRQLIQATTAR